MYELKLNRDQWVRFNKIVSRHEAATYSNPRAFASDALQHAGAIANDPAPRGVEVVGIVPLRSADALSGEIG